MGEVSINCYIVGRSLKVFPVKIDNRRDVLELRRLIKNTKPKVFEDANPSDLKLWWVKIPLKDDFELSILRNKDFSIADINYEKKLLSPRTPISDYYHAKGARKPDENCINLLVNW